MGNSVSRKVLHFVLVPFLFLYGIYPVFAKTGEARLRNRLKSAETWMYQIQNLEEAGSIQVLSGTEFPLLVLEPNVNQRGLSFDTRKMVERLRTTPSGNRRILLAYIDIGQAEDWRTYWKKDWRPPTAKKQGSPSFLICPDPDGWGGCFPVAFWRNEWKSIWVGESGLVSLLSGLGFDGVYLDWVEAYDDEKVRGAGRKEGVDPELEMIQFLEEIRRSGKSGKSGKSENSEFLVIVQNAPYLLNVDPKRVLAAIDGLAVEDTWFRGKGDSEWDSPDSGDIPNDFRDEWSIENRLKQYRKFLEGGVPVFSVDYCVDSDNAKFVYSEAQKAGLKPLVTRVSLSRMTETPPDFD